MQKANKLALCLDKAGNMCVLHAQVSDDLILFGARG